MGNRQRLDDEYKRHQRQIKLPKSVTEELHRSLAPP
jgi:hypothetical protein